MRKGKIALWVSLGIVVSVFAALTCMQIFGSGKWQPLQWFRGSSTENVTPSEDPTVPDPPPSDPIVPDPPADPTDPAEPTDPTEPTDPIDPTDPTDPSEDPPTPSTTHRVVQKAEAGNVLSDPAGKYAAFYTDAYVDVYKVGEPYTLALRVSRTTERVYLCSDGALGLWSEQSLTIYEQDAQGVYSSFTVSLPRGNASILVREGTRYHAAYRRTSAVYRLEITREGANQLHLGRVTSALFLLGRCGDAIFYADKTLSVHLLDTEITDTYACTELSTRTATRNMSGTGDGYAVVRESDKTYLYDLCRNTVTEIESGTIANGRVLYNAQYVYLFDPDRGAVRIDDVCDVSEDCASVCLIGDSLLVSRSDGLYAYPM